MADAAPSQDWDARLYDEKHAFVWQQAAALVELLAPQPGERILDLGCGTGHLTAQIAQRRADVVGIDSSVEMIGPARQHYPALRFEIADARFLVCEEEFDAVFSNAVLHWIPEAELVVESVARALKPGGRFVAEFGGKGNVRVILAALQQAARQVGCGLIESPWYFPSVAEYASLLERAGLEVTLATLFDRPTRLEGEAGLRHWVEMFGGPFLSRIPANRREKFFQAVEAEARHALHRDDAWHADYRRLRVVAWRRGSAK